MKGKLRLSALVLCAVFLLSLAFFTGCTEDDETTVPEPVKKINSVMITYNDARVTGGIISVDVSAETLTLGAVVTKTGAADTTVTFTSSDPAVASINAASGVVTLNTKGETVIKAVAGDKSHEIILAVADDYDLPAKHNITVIGGTSNVSSSAKGEYVTLTAGMPPHMEFLRWEYTVNGSPAVGLWINGNIFAMPEGNITITAIYEDMLYTLNVINGIVKNDDSGQLIGGKLVYKFIYGTAITTVANTEPPGKMFVGWDYKVKDNRQGELGETELDFDMPGENISVSAVFSDKSQMNLNLGSLGEFNRAANGYKVINDGVPAGEAADPDLEGMSGGRLAIPANQSARVDFPENIEGSSLTTMYNGSQTIEIIFKNHHKNVSVNVEFYATCVGTVLSSGVITVPAGQVVKEVFIASIGFHNPWMGFAVRSNLTGSSGDYVLLDMVVQKADTYPDGDKQFSVSGAAKWVTLHDGSTNLIKNPFTKHSWEGGEEFINNNFGMTAVRCYGRDLSGSSYMYTKVANMPSFNPDEPTTTIYFRLINTNANINTLKFHFSTGTTLSNGSELLASQEIILEANEVKLFAMNIPRSANTGQIYFIISKPISDGGGLYGHNFAFQMVYNNVIGVQE